MAYGHGQPHCCEGHAIHRLAAIDGRQRLGEDRVTPRSGGPMIARRLGGSMELILLLGAVLALGNIVASVAVLRVSVLSPSTSLASGGS